MKLLQSTLISKQAIQQLPYFRKASLILPPHLISHSIRQLFTNLKSISIPKGTIIYAMGDTPDNLYFLTKGTVELIIKKTPRQKLQTYPNHIIYSTSQKLAYLRDRFGIESAEGQKLIEMFYEEKVLFRYMSLRVLQGEGQLGIGEMMRNTSRLSTAIATTNTELLLIDKDTFNLSMRELQLKKQLIYTQKIINTFGSNAYDELAHRMPQVINMAELKVLQKDEILYQQGTTPRFIYLIFTGEVQLRKTISLQIPNKYIQNQNKPFPKKVIPLKLITMGEGSFIGQYQIVNFSKKRQFTVVATNNTTIILEIEPLSFIKAISQYHEGEKLFMVNAKSKVDSALSNYHKQRKHLQKTFKNQYDNYQATKKQQQLNPKIKQQLDVKNQFYQIFGNNGLFYRDIFQKIQGFDFDHLPKSKSIKKVKTKSIVAPLESAPSTQSATHKLSKILFSPKASINQAEILIKNILTHEDQHPIIPKKTKSFEKLYQLKKDQQIFKRVMIKHGLYQKDREVDRSRISKPIINYNFDQVIRQCISRKNPSIRRADNYHKAQMIKQSYLKTVKSLKFNKSVPRMTISNPCLGTEQMRKRMEPFKNSRRFQSPNQNVQINSSPLLEECIGVNSEPKSRQVKYRSSIKNRNKTSQIPQRIVLLNHMMKPITYNSLEI